MSKWIKVPFVIILIIAILVGGIEGALSYIKYKGNTLDTNTILACFLILIFLVSTVLVRRYRSIR